MTGRLQEETFRFPELEIQIVPVGIASLGELIDYRMLDYSDRRQYTTLHLYFGSYLLLLSLIV